MTATPRKKVYRLSEKALLERAHAARRRVEVARGELEDAVAERDIAIKALSSRGMSRRQVAQITGVTVGRVQQIVGGVELELDPARATSSGTLAGLTAGKTPKKRS